MDDGVTTAVSRSRRPPPRVDEFFYEPAHSPPDTIFCSFHRSSTCSSGFQGVSRLEQYTFLLHIALRRLYVHFRLHYALPSGEPISLPYIRWC